MGGKAEKCCIWGSRSCGERVWPQLLGGEARLSSIPLLWKGQKGRRRQRAPRRPAAGSAVVGTSPAGMMLEGCRAEGLVALAGGELKAERSPGRGKN